MDANKDKISSQTKKRKEKKNLHRIPLLFVFSNRVPVFIIGQR